jgi:DNA modification methylase
LMLFHQSSCASLYHGDVMAVLPALPAGSVQCVVTSPPYFALRSYLPKGDPLKPLEIGSEPTPEAFIQTMVAVFREVRRVLRDDGVCFINLGDSYATKPVGSFNGGGECFTGRDMDGVASSGRVDTTCFAPSGNLLNIPHRVAEALRADGWIWRQTIVWAKRSPMPESVSGWRWVRCRVKVAKQGMSNSAGQHYPPELGHAERDRNPDSSRNPELRAQYIPCPGCPKCEKHGGYVLRRGSGRCTTAHEYVFVMAKTGRYFWDGEASKEHAQYGRSQELGAKIWNRSGVPSEPCRVSSTTVPGEGGSRNPRSVWTLSSEPTKVRHFATFPSELVRRCLVAGVSAGGCCPHCGAPWAPVVETPEKPPRVDYEGKNLENDPQHAHRRILQAVKAARMNGGSHDNPFTAPSVLGYRPTCDCPPHEATGCVVLDPFNGIGTTGQTAITLGCRYIGIDLNREYLDVAAKRIYEPPRWWLRKHKPKAAPKVLPGQLSLFSR